jgi:predicted small lipoprotein YifL
MKTFKSVATIVGLALALAACGPAGGLPVADAKPVASNPVLYPQVAAGAADGQVHEYH